MDRLIQYGKRYFFTGRDPRDMGIARILFYSFMLWRSQNNVFTHKYLDFSKVPEIFWNPVSLFKLIPADSFKILIHKELAIAYLVSLFLCAIGLGTKYFSKLALILSFLIIGFPNNFGDVYDSTCFIILAYGFFAFSRCGDYYSLDRLIFKKKVFPLEDQRTQWAQNILLFMMLFFYFCCGLQKLRNGGFDYFISDDLGMAFIYHNSPVGMALSNMSWLHIPIKVFGVLIQLSAGILYFKKRWYPLWAIFFLFFHITVDYTLTVHFEILKICYVALFPWHQFASDLFKIFRSKRELKTYQVEEAPKKVSPLYGGSFIILVFMATLAPIMREHIYPFSSCEMYTTAEFFPFHERQVYGVDEKGESHILTKKEYSPMDPNKINLSIELLLEKGRARGEIIRGVRDLLFTNTGRSFDRLVMKRCSYLSLQEAQRLYPSAEHCEVIDELKL